MKASPLIVLSTSGLIDISGDRPFASETHCHIRNDVRLAALKYLELTVSIELTTCCLQDSCSARLSYVSNIVGAGAHAHSRV